MFEPILTADQMLAAERVDKSDLIEKAGLAAAEAIVAFCGPAPVLVLAGPGNNGADGRVVARILRERGWPVRVSADADIEPAAILVDALFGTGLKRGLDPGLVTRLHHLAEAAKVRVALDLPSGAASDDGACLSPLIAADLTVAFGALKPAHLLYPAAASMGRIVVADLGLGVISSALRRNDRPQIPDVASAAHKYQRGHVLVIGGAMPGAAWLAARAAQRAGAGYVTLAGDAALPPSSLVVRAPADAGQADAVVIGPGLGRDETARQRARAALEPGYPAVLDADLFTLFADDPQALFGRNDVMTPHDEEFTRFFGSLPGNKVDRARSAAARSGNVIVLKGPDTVVAAPDGRAVINGHASPRLATAGSGDVLAGIIAALLARGMPAFEAASAGVWLHGDAARRGQDGLIAEDLIALIA